MNVLRRSRSAPTLASGQLSYADILKASIKATSAPSLPSGSSGYVSLPFLESNPPAVSAHPSSPVVTISSPQARSISPSSAETGHSRPSSRLTVSLTPTRTMKPLRRLVLKNSKSDNNLRDRMDKTQMSAPMKSLLSSFQPISEAESSSSNGSGSGTMAGPTSSDSHHHGHPSTDDDGGQVETKDCARSSSETIELRHREDFMANKDARELLEEETSVPRAIDVQQGQAVAVMKNPVTLQDSTASATATSAAGATGLSFFRPPEELDEQESSPETVRHAQTIVAVSMLKFDHQDSTNVSSEDCTGSLQKRDSDGTVDSSLLLHLEEKRSLPEQASAFLVKMKEDAAAPAAAEEEIDSHVKSSETLQRNRRKSDEGPSTAAMPAPEQTSAECPFQKQLVLQEQEQLQIQIQAQEDLDGLSSQQSKATTVTTTTTTTATAGEGFKPRRRRNNSSGGKKILLKKKTSAKNLHSNVVHALQQTQSSPKIEDDDGDAEDSPSTSGTTTAGDHVIPPFYFPMGRPLTASKRRQKVLNALAKAREVFASAESETLNEAGFVAVTVQCCELPRYMNRALFRKVDAVGSNEVRLSELEHAWEFLAEGCPDEISMIFMILKQHNKNVLTPTDFEVVLQDLVLFHPGLEFLSGNAVFQERYLETVITRIFYEANRRHGKMSLADLRRSQFDKTLRKLENSDLNQTEDCFSYKHFYVIYCKFWELDQDHDLILDEQDLAGYSGGAISSRIIRRVMQGYGNETGMFMVPDQELLLQQQQQLMLMQQRQLQQQDLELELEKQKELERELEQGQRTEQSAPSSSEDKAQQLVENTGPADSSETSTETAEADLDGSPVQQPKALRRSVTLSSVDLASIESADNAPIFNNTDSDMEVSKEGDMATSPADTNTTTTTTTTATSPLMATTAGTAAAGTAIVAPFVRTTPPGPGSQCHPQNYRMTYKGFIWFLLAETDKQTVTSIEYWFRCMDLDGDGILTVFELEQLFQEQATRMAILGMESFGFRDAICQMQDLVSPKEPGLVRLSDLKQCGQAGPFIDLFCNVVRWRSFEAHQHQIRMRQQQIAMQRAADAAWEEGEKLFNSVVDGDGDDDDDDEDDDDDHEDRDGDTASGEGDDDLSVSDQDEQDDDSVSEADEEGDESCSVGSDDVDGLLQNTTAGDHTPIAKGTELPSPTTEASVAAAAAVAAKQRALKRKRRVQERRQRKQQRQQQRQEQTMMRRVILEEQRKEKALLATIRESPWIVYVESEYEKLVTIERPQSRTEWDQEEDDEEEEDEEMEEEEEEEEVMDEEDMMMEEGRESSVASLQHQQHLQLQHQQFLLQQQQQLRQEQEQQLQLHQLQEGFSSQIEADVMLSNGTVGLMMEAAKTPSHDGGSHKMTVGTGTLMEIGQDFEQISMDSHSMETNGAGVVAIGDVA
ncbi:Serine/threonine-protein phosphatase 2A regulatory subunit B'' subunit beta [Mortierella alpina]|nr:Serine/threonine-protein phosphatase 2A regulatory subunit B'' subunit beta [Mortierella alpina]